MLLVLSGPVYPKSPQAKSTRCSGCDEGAWLQYRSKQRYLACTTGPRYTSINDRLSPSTLLKLYVPDLDQF